VFVWTDREWVRLREILQPGDLLAGRDGQHVSDCGSNVWGCSCH
jgi:hypothetical protein